MTLSGVVRLKSAEALGDKGLSILMEKVLAELRELRKAEPTIDTGTAALIFIGMRLKSIDSSLASLSNHADDGFPVRKVETSG